MPSLIAAYENGTLAEMQRRERESMPASIPDVSGSFCDQDDGEDDEPDPERMYCRECSGTGYQEMLLGACPDCEGTGTKPEFW
jgi:DnaJ-class molecular chaperone